jgi:hypothetical protein
MLGDKLSAAQAEVGATRLAEAMGRATNWEMLTTFGYALGAFGAKLPAAQAEVGASRLLEAMAGTTDWRPLYALSMALGELGENLTTGQAEAAALRLVEAMRATRVREHLYYLGYAVGLNLGRKLPPKLMVAVLLRLVDARSSVTDDHAWENAIDVAIDVLLNELLTVQAEGVPLLLTQAVAALSGSGYKKPPRSSDYLGQFTTAQAEEVALRLVQAMGATTDAAVVSSLGGAVGELRANLPAAQAEAGALRLLETMSATKDVDLLLSLAGALARFDEKLPAAQAEAGALRLMETMSATKDVDLLLSLAGTLASFGDKLPAAQAEAGALRVVEVMATNTDDGELWRFIDMLRRFLLNRLTSVQRRVVLGRLVQVVSATTDIKALRDVGSLLQGYSRLWLPVAQAEAFALHLAERIKTVRDADAFVDLGKTLGSIRLALNPQKVDSAVDLLQAPMAHGETLKHLLLYYSRLAGLPENREFETKDDFVAWVREHRVNLDLNRRPRNPFR